MNDGKKKKLLALNRESELTLPLVQRINQRVFVVRCDIGFNFPTGLLHVTCNADDKSCKELLLKVWITLNSFRYRMI